MKQGTRGDETSKSTVPTRQRSPTSAPVTSRPDVVRFSPIDPGGTGRPSCSDHQIRSSCGVGVGGAVGTAVGLPVGLVVAVDVHAVGGDPTGHGLLVDAGGDVAVVVGDVADLPDVDRDEDGAVRLAFHDQLRAGAQAFGTLRYLPGISTVLLVALLACSSAFSDTLSFLAMPIQ